jgi:predicted DNA-binding transcriptional regulator YafY
MTWRISPPISLTRPVGCAHQEQRRHDVLAEARQRSVAADETWHPDQRVEAHGDGGVLLELPYRHVTEILMDVLRYGAEVEVLEPAELPRSVSEAHIKAAARYAG